MFLKTKVYFDWKRTLKLVYYGIIDVSVLLNYYLSKSMNSVFDRPPSDADVVVGLKSMPDSLWYVLSIYCFCRFYKDGFAYIHQILCDFCMFYPWKKQNTSKDLSIFPLLFISMKLVSSNPLSCTLLNKKKSTFQSSRKIEYLFVKIKLMRLWKQIESTME